MSPSRKSPLVVPIEFINDNLAVAEMRMISFDVCVAAREPFVTLRRGERFFFTALKAANASRSFGLYGSSWLAEACGASLEFSRNFSPPSGASWKLSPVSLQPLSCRPGGPGVGGKSTSRATPARGRDCRGRKVRGEVIGEATQFVSLAGRA